ncbi:hypothetical protein KY285_033120 [Solanum tuberosum]|nr:hypothetical protein KY289_033232 [Solanum tuberosum]KAH0647872.1 hypothetical protein KY285_033120 [Solanum tuberosum]
MEESIVFRPSAQVSVRLRIRTSFSSAHSPFARFSKQRKGDQISSLYQLIYYGREDPQFFIDPQDLDSILRVHLEPFEFNHPALCQVLESLCGDREESPFYAEVKRTQAEHSHRRLPRREQAPKGVR